MINVKMQQSDTQPTLAPKIAVIGVGGAGGNAVNNMIASNLEGCEFIVCNTDAQALTHSLATNKIQLGEQVTGGLGAGSKPQVGQAAAEESLEEVMEHLDGANMAFVTAGMGGGTGTGAAPVIAKACRERGILTVGVVTKPFHFEGSHRMRMAEAGIKEMQSYVDTLIVIPNQNLFRVANEKTTFADGFKMADSVLQSGVRGVTDLMVRPGLVNLDFADIRTAMLEMGKAMMGTGEATGEKRAIEAAEAAINNPLLDDVTMKGARGVIINVTGGYDMTLFEADEACNRIRDEVDPNANIIFGATFDEKMEGTMRVSIVSTGIEREALEAPKDEDTTDEPPKGTSKKEERTYKTGIDNVRGITAPVAPAQSTATAAVATATASAEAPAQAPAPKEAAPMSTPAAQTEAMRGTRYKDAFIPPQPVTAPRKQDEAPASTSSMPTMSAPAEPMAAPAPQQPVQTHEIKHETAPGLVLNPPKKTDHAHGQPEKTNSFFSRIAETIQQSLHKNEDSKRLMQNTFAQPQPHAQTQQPQPQTVSSPSLGNAAMSTQEEPAQGQLNIDAPAASPRSEEDLDIPAFLRRQAN